MAPCVAVEDVRGLPLVRSRDQGVLPVVGATQCASRSGDLERVLPTAVTDFAEEIGTHAVEIMRSCIVQPVPVEWSIGELTQLREFSNYVE